MRNLLLLLLLWLSSFSTMGAQSWIAQLRTADQCMEEKAWQEAVVQYTNVINATSDETARMECLQHRASCYKHLDKLDLAQSDYEAALGLASDLKTKSVVGYNMSDLLIQTGQYARVVELLESISFDQPGQEVRRLANLATAYAYAAQPKKALALMDSVININVVHDATYASLMQNRGFVLLDMGRYDQALQSMQMALPQLKGNSYYITLANIAVVEAGLGRFDEALGHIDNVLAWQARNMGVLHSTYIISLRKKAEILLKARRMADASLTFKSYFDAEKQYVLANFPKMDEQSRLDFWLKENPLVSEIFSMADDANASFLYDVALFRRNMALIGNNVASRQPLLDEVLQRSSSMVIGKLQPHDAALEFVCYKDIMTGDSVYAALLSTKTCVRYVHIASKKDILNYRMAGTTLHKAVCSGASYANVIYCDTVFAAKVWGNIYKALPAGTNRLFFAPEGMFQLLAIENLPYSPLEKIELRRVSSTDRIHTADKLTTSKALVVGGLNYDEFDNSRLATVSIDDNITAYHTAKSLLGFPLAFKPLPATTSEVDTIEHIMNVQAHRTMWENDLKKSMGDYQILHFATHGYSLRVSLDVPSLLSRDSLRHDNSLWASGLALTGANVEGRLCSVEDGLLSAREVCDLDLSGVRFVALSACQTAQGLVSDEGPAGMVRAFKKAGAGTIIATLWAVNDKSTRLFMKAFYQAWLSEHKDVHTAFKIAQQYVRQYSVPQVRHQLPLAIHRQQRQGGKPQQPQMINPYSSARYWAPFIIID